MASPENNASNTILRGQMTFDAEGTNVRGSRNYSRVVHWPGNELSGVTIGRGYDLGNRTQEQAYSDLRRVGISESQARAISLGVDRKGTRAREFVNNNRSTIGEITAQQEVMLFNMIYPNYENRARRNYNRYTRSLANRTEWEQLHPAIRDVVVDMVYQGFAGESAMSVASGNDIDEFIQYIRNKPAYMEYEGNRKRIDYLDNNR
ncbi:pesticin C-terminus-like muramidase [Enterobacillus tribolii]|uniref:Phage lysozyme-like predicted toxin n=1 Tax=Enterobacillus tribolii TaxID=1487935 RepID=A0A370QGD1_9GAMM|nr:pesticin C-terminus-like muramidase [Enterobacillus tribolii]MBW7981740.1 calcium-binding protein [Enterobacillus tribolii]RDK87424.1 phage lysozyme-like predicted toxin [Enterobacillus tribolii]